MTRRRVGPVYRGPRSYKALAERLLDQCVIHLRGSFRARPKQQDEFFFEGPYFQGDPKYGTERASYSITHNESGARVSVDVNPDLTLVVDADSRFPKEALRCLDPAFNAMLEGSSWRKK